MALPSNLRLKGHRTFKYIHKNSKKYYGKLMDLKVAKSNPKILISHGINTNTLNFKLAITVSKKISKKAVIRNKIRRRLHELFLKDFKKEYNHIPYWVLVNLKVGNFFKNESEFFQEFQSLILKIGQMR